MAKKKEGVSEKEIIASIEKGQYATLYALDGEEPYYIDKICDLLEQKVLTTAEKDFNLSIFYGKDAVWSEVVSACRRFPMFAEKQLVILKEAQAMRDLDKLEVYLDNPSETTIFVIAYKYKTLDKRKSFTKKIQQKGICFTSDPIKEYNIKDWISTYLSSKKLQADAKVLETLAVYLGTDLQKIINEIDKVLLNIPNATTLTSELVEKYIGISREYNVYELPNALLTLDIEATYRMVNYFAANPKDAPMVLVLGSFFAKFQQLYTYHFIKNKPQGEIAAAIKVNPYFVKDYATYARHFTLEKTEKALHLLKEFNLKSLGVNNTASEQSLLKEMVTKLLYL